MSNKRTLRQVAVAVMLLVAFLFQGTWALAGTTGGLSGTVTDDSGAPIGGASVKVVSASQSASATTDNGGHFSFLSLAPDTYTVSVDKSGYNPVSYAGVTVFADNQQSYALKLNKALKEIAKVSARSAGALVKAGTTSDVYSVNSATAAKVSGLGGGGSLDQAYSAIATMPGAYVPVGQAGWYQAVYIRGGDYDQVGYEVDGVPVNRAFDNYPSNTASALGQQEVQVYTGANPANSEGQGLSGFINQVIKTGTYPGFATSDLGVGSPIFYHKANIEAGGASPDRMFSYYAGFGGYNQASRYVDNSNGAGYQNNWGYPIGIPCPAAPTAGYSYPGCYNEAGTYEPGWMLMGPYNFYGNELITDRENVVNFHFAIPHHHDGGRDDLQLLWQSSDLKTNPYGAPSEYGSQAFYNELSNLANYGQVTTPAGSPFVPLMNFPVSKVYKGTMNQLFAPGAPASSYGAVQTYCFPSADPTVACGGAIPYTLDDSVDNAVGIVKLQYQKNLSSSAYLRLYGYTVYSNWFNWGPNSASLCCTGVPVDYELFTHTRGFSGTFADQINSKNLVQLQGSYSSATSTRMNNGTMFNGGGTRIGVLVDSTNPNSGVCYNAAGAPANCDKQAAHFNLNQLAAYQASGTALPAVAATCGAGPCAWDMVDTGYSGRNNTVQPRFWSASLTDEFDPTDRLHINLGFRFDSYQYIPSNSNREARPFWTNAWNNSYCVDSSILGAAPVEKPNPTAACTTLGATFVPATVTSNSSTQTYTVAQPRVGVTYTVNPLNVLRFSYGKYDQAPNAAFEQYDSLNQNLPRSNRNFYTLGFTAPTHPIRPEISYNTDFSWEHQFKGTDMSFKATPFYRQTKDQIQQFYLDIRTNFVSGLNVGAQTSSGIELQLQKGDFSKNGLAALLSYTYTNAYVKYSVASNGTTPVTGINQAIQQYNAWTSACAGGSTASQYGQALCGSTGSAVAAPCYTTAGAPIASSAACVAGTIANPYWNAPVQGLYDPSGKYAPYDLFPAAAPGAGGYGSFVAPHVLTLVLNYKHDKFAIAPALQFSGGNRYGYPIAQTGIDPSTCSGFLAGATSGDPRYPYGGAGSPFDATTCGGGPAIPNAGSKMFDGVGAYTQPNRFTVSTQMSYDLNPRLSAVLTLANLVDSCSGGTKAAWTNPIGIPQNKICSYGGGYAGVGLPPVGNAYNPAAGVNPMLNVQPFARNSYTPGIGSLPFNAYFDLKIKL